MAGRLQLARTGLLDTGTGAADTEKTFLQVITATNLPIVLKTLRISARESSSTALQDGWTLRIQTSAGTPGTSAQVPAVLNGLAGTPLTTFAFNFSAEPSQSTILFGFNLQPMQGMIYPYTQDLENIVIPGGSRVGVVRVAGALLNYKVGIDLVFEE